MLVEGACQVVPTEFIGCAPASPEDVRVQLRTEVKEEPRACGTLGASSNCAIL